MSSHPATASRTFASGGFSQRGERLRVVDDVVAATTQAGGKNRRHDPPSRGPSFGSLSSGGICDSISSLGNSRFGSRSSLRRAPSFSFILKFDNNNKDSNNHYHTTGGREGGEGNDDVLVSKSIVADNDHNNVLRQQQKTIIINKKRNNNKKVSMNEILYILEKLYYKYHIVILITIAILLARLYPPLGATYLVPHITSSWIAVMEIFTLIGMGIKTDIFSDATQRVEFNIFVQGFSFVFISAIIYGLSRGLIATDILDDSLANGMVICSCLPSTLNMVLVFTRISGGNENAAIFNCTFGTIIGLIVGPILMIVYLGPSSPDMNVLDVFLRIIIRVIVPTILGQFLQKQSKTTMRFVRRYRKYIMYGQQLLLTFVVYTMFCQNFERNNTADDDGDGTYRLSSHQLVSIFVMLVIQSLLLCVFKVISWHSLDILYTNDPKLRCMGLFGCTHKSLAIGIPLINVIFESDPNIGLLMLPLFVWHTVQLFLGSWIAPTLLVWSSREQRRLGMSKTENDDDSSDDASEIGDDGHFVQDEESLVSSINGSHVSFATSANDTSQNSEIVRAPKTSKVFNTQAAAVQRAKAREVYASITEDKETAVKLEEDTEVAIAERVDAPNSTKRTMIPHDNFEIMVNSRGASVDTEDGNSAQATANSSQNPSVGKSEKSKGPHSGCHSDHRCYEVGVVYEAIAKPLDLLVMKASHQKLNSCADCAMKVGHQASEEGVRPEHGFPIYVCRECMNHLVCNRCWRKSKVPGWANHLFDMYF